ncbi:MAG: helix-turn-helix domain-containing protein [Acidimicrobiales bacterium]
MSSPADPSRPRAKTARAPRGEHPFLVAARPVIEALGAEVVASGVGGVQEPLDIPLVWEGEIVGIARPHDLHGALDRLLERVAEELGAPLAELSREDKQRAVQLLEERGAFNLRKSVEDAAQALQVSRFTVYNYLSRMSAEKSEPNSQRAAKR